jgi:hypothetical protein
MARTKSQVRPNTARNARTEDLSLQAQVRMWAPVPASVLRVPVQGRVPVQVPVLAPVQVQVPVPALVQVRVRLQVQVLVDRACT